MLQKTFNSFRFAWNGLVTVWKEEFNFRIEVCAAIVVLFCLWYFNFSLIESGLCIIAIIIVLTAEILNTAVEDLCNKVDALYNPTIGKIKDTMGGFVLVSVMGAIILAVLVAYHHFF